MGARRVELGYYNICLFVDIKTQFMQRHYYQTLLTFESRLQATPAPPQHLPPPRLSVQHATMWIFTLRLWWFAIGEKIADCRLQPRCVDLCLTLTTLAFHLMTYCLSNRCKFNGKLSDLRLKGARNNWRSIQADLQIEYRGNYQGICMNSSPINSCFVCKKLFDLLSTEIEMCVREILLEIFTLIRTYAYHM